jgi:hypothetical protein
MTKLEKCAEETGHDLIFSTCLNKLMKITKNLSEYPTFKPETNQKQRTGNHTTAALAGPHSLVYTTYLYTVTVCYGVPQD